MSLRLAYVDILELKDPETITNADGGTTVDEEEIFETHFPRMI